MGTPSAATLVDLWEAGRLASPHRRAGLLLAAACPQQPAEALADLPIGRRDGLLLGLRERLFGPQLTGVADCPACAERLELSFTVADIRAGPPLEGPLGLDLDGYAVAFRLPTGADLEAVAGCGPRAGAALLARCVLGARYGDLACSAEDLPAAVAAAVAAGMAEADPQADVQLALGCPGCGHSWRATFDIVSYLWGELESWALRTLGEVHTLARAYAWPEAAILGLSEYRRRHYLALAASGG